VLGGGLFGRGLGCGGLGWGGLRGVGKGLINHGVEIGLGPLDLNKRGTLAAGGDDEDGGGVVNAGPAAQVGVGLYVGGKLALRIERKRQGDAVALGKLLSELAEQLGVVVEVGLIGKDLVAVFIAEGVALEVEPAGIDGGYGAPGMRGDEEVVANDGDVVLGGSRPNDGVGGAADRAFHINKFNDGYTCAGRRVERGGVHDMGSGRRCGELGLGHGAGEEKQRGDSQGEEQRCTVGTKANRRGKAKVSKHRYLTAPYE